jgi:cytochrome P450
VPRRIVATKWLNDIVGGQLARDQQKMLSFARDAMARRLKEEEARKHTDDEHKDIFHYLFRAKDPQTGAQFSPEEISSESELLLIAGGDTTSTVLSACLFYLAHNPQVLKRLTSEIRSNFENIEDVRPSNPTLSRLPYLRACIDESMRMSPPAVGPLPRKVLTGGALIDGEYYSPGAEVAVTTYALHHREENFPDRFSFRPERWIPDDKTGVTEADVALAQAAFAPFSIGPRNCMGKNLAYMELNTAVARLVWLYDLKMVDMGPTGEGGEDKIWGRRRKGEYQVADFFVAERDGPLLALKAR